MRATVGAADASSVDHSPSSNSSDVNPAHPADTKHLPSRPQGKVRRFGRTGDGSGTMTSPQARGRDANYETLIIIITIIYNNNNRNKYITKKLIFSGSAEPTTHAQDFTAARRTAVPQPAMLNTFHPSQQLPLLLQDSQTGTTTAPRNRRKPMRKKNEA